MRSVRAHPIGTPSTHGVLDVGLKCVHSCKFCYYVHLDGTDDAFRGMRQAEFRTADECRAIIDGMKANGLTGFDVTGGEPTIHRDLVDLIRHATDLGMTTRVITLGQFLMQRMPGTGRNILLDALLDAGLTNLLLSVHAVDDENAKSIHGGSWTKQAWTMARLDDDGFQFTTNTTVTELNAHLLPDIARELVRHGVYMHNFIVMNAYYQWGQQGKTEGVQARYSSLLEPLREAVGILDDAGRAVNIRYVPLCTVPGLERHVVGVMGVRYDPYEWMNLAGHMGGDPEHCSTLVPLNARGVEKGREAQAVRVRLEQVGGKTLPISGQREGKLFPEDCGRCAWRDACDGVDPKYLTAHGSSEFVPPAGAPYEYAPLHSARRAYREAFLVKTAQDADMLAAIQAVREGREP